MTFLIGWISCAIGVLCVTAMINMFTNEGFTWEKFATNFFFSSFIYGLIQVWIGG